MPLYTLEPAIPQPAPAAREDKLRLQRQAREYLKAEVEDFQDDHPGCVKIIDGSWPSVVLQVETTAETAAALAKLRGVAKITPSQPTPRPAKYIPPRGPSL